MFREYHNEKHGCVDLDDAIAHSCDVYFYGLADSSASTASPPSSRPSASASSPASTSAARSPACCPRASGRRKAFASPADQIWFPGETVNFGIGQGYLIVTPLQLAHYAGVIAMRGKVWKPRLVTGLPRRATGKMHAACRRSRMARSRGVSAEDWDARRARHGRSHPARHGARRSARRRRTRSPARPARRRCSPWRRTRSTTPDAINERLRDHSWFIAFAPAEEPRIAVAVLAENGGFGAERRGADRAQGARRLPAGRGRQPSVEARAGQPLSRYRPDESP